MSLENSYTIVDEIKFYRAARWAPNVLVGLLFRRLTLVMSSSSGLSPLEFALRLVALKCDSVEIERVLPIDNILTIKSVTTY